MAQDVANGHLPPAALDAVWAAVEGVVSREAQLLRDLVESYDAAVQARHVAVAYHTPPVTDEDRYRHSIAVELSDKAMVSISAAREWIESQG